MYCITFHLEHANGSLRRDSILSLYGRLILSDTSAGRVIPFYLQDTLEGTDINGDPSLRGFADYRFRGPDSMVMEAQWDRRLWKVLGIMIFYDAGRVAMQKSDLDFSNLHHSVGGGLDSVVGFEGGIPSLCRLWRR